MSCVICHLPDARFTCGRCEHRSYCSKTCQLKDWETHVRYCKITKHMLQVANEAQSAYFYAHGLGEKDVVGLNRRNTVLRKDDRVYKLAKSEKEYLETYSFYKKHQSVAIVPFLIEADSAAWVIVTKYEEDFITLHRIVTDNQEIDRDALQLALIEGLAQFKEPSFGKDMLSNLSNIGYNGQCVIFFEDNGERFEFDSHPEMIFQFLQLMCAARSGNLLLDKRNIRRVNEIRVIYERVIEVHSENETWTED